MADESDGRVGTTAYVDRLAPAWIPDTEQRCRARRARTLTFAAMIGLLWGLVAASFWAVGTWVDRCCAG